MAGGCRYQLVRATWPDDWSYLWRLVFLGVLVLVLLPVRFGVELVSGEAVWGSDVGWRVGGVFVGSALIAVPLAVVATYLVSVAQLYRRDPTWRKDRRDAREATRHGQVVRTLFERLDTDTDHSDRLGSRAGRHAL